jgi:hypothetical protein
MTYNQIVDKIQTLLESHPMIKEVRFSSPAEWLFRDNQPVFPSANFVINSGGLNVGREMTFSTRFWFLDKSGVEGEFETDVISDQHQIANDIIAQLRKDFTISIDTNITWNAISEKFEDYLSGVEFTITISTTDQYQLCSLPS